MPIYTLGFPGKVMDPYRVVADFRGGNIARLTNFQSEQVDAAANQFVWHTALISKGTSGSPIFDRFGQVVAVNNGTMSAEKIVTSNGTTEEVKFIYSADGLNFGVRVDVLRELAARQGVELPVPPADLESMFSESAESDPADGTTSDGAEGPVDGATPAPAGETPQPSAPENADGTSGDGSAEPKAAWPPQ